MSHTARQLSRNIFLSLVIITGCTLMGCSLFDRRPSAHAQMAKFNKQKVFFAKYDDVWRAAHSVIKYPIAQENQDSGVIETDYIKGLDGWISPDVNAAPSSGTRYKLFFTFAQGSTEGRDSVRLTIDKKVEILRDFFSEPESVESDGLEEKILFYRIEREILINDALKRAK